MVWLVYEQNGQRLVIIERGGFVLAARLRASIAHGIDRYYVEGHELPPGTEVAPEIVGKLLTARQAARVLKAIEGG